MQGSELKCIEVKLNLNRASKFVHLPLFPRQILTGKTFPQSAIARIMKDTERDYINFSHRNEKH